MTQYTSIIAAVSTPPGKGGVAIIRICGEGATELAERVFFPAAGKKLSEYAPRMQVFGYIVKDGERIDDGLTAVFPAPSSYTGEETVEISCHGGMLVTREVLSAVLAAGARYAEPGEFTRRAFINGKLSLTEAEAIGVLLDAESTSQIRLASKGSRDLLTEKIAEIRRGLVEILSSIYARIDYPDEDLGDFSDAEACERLKKLHGDMVRLAETYKTGHSVNEGIRTVICGKPNVGKSTVYNILLGRDAAIVTDISGTTRDVLTEKIPLGDVLLTLSDTAGVRDDAADKVEAIGIERTKREMEKAELIIAVFDASAPRDKEDLELLTMLEGLNVPKIALLNKCDTGSAVSHFSDGETSLFEIILEISAANRPSEVRELLRDAAEKLFTDEKIRIGSEAIISSARQNASLACAVELTRGAISAFEIGMSADAVSSDIERALAQIAEIDGRAVSEEVVADIFSKFCVGK